MLHKKSIIIRSMMKIVRSILILYLFYGFLMYNRDRSISPKKSFLRLQIRREGEK